MLTNVTFVGHTQRVRQQKLIKSNNTCNLTNTCNSIKYHQRNEPSENWDIGTSCEINKHPKNETIYIF